MAAKARVLVVDDNPEMARMIADALNDAGHDGIAASSGTHALEQLQAGGIDALVTDLRMPDVDGMQLLAASKRLLPERPVLVMTAYSAVDTAVESIRRGASHYVTKPFKLDELLLFLARSLEELALRREAKALKSALFTGAHGGQLVAESEAMRRVLDVAARVARSSVPLLLMGQTGTGKSLLARHVHALSDRSAHACVTVNCAALPENLLESELFGHVKGAFTGAVSSRPGLFVEASGGTLFLDEIGDMALPLQAKLLHVIERGLVRPVGAEREVAVDVRLIAATHRDLRDAVRKGTFRDDLLFRLDVVTIEVPPLSHRRSDIPALLSTFLAAAKSRHAHSPVERFSRALTERLLEYPWPGNVRELQHVVERVVVLAHDVEADLDALPDSVRIATPPDGLSFSGEVMPIRRLQSSYAQWALARMGGHKGRTAERLDVDQKTLARWLTRDDDER